MIHAFTTSPQRNLARTPDSSVRGSSYSDARTPQPRRAGEPTPNSSSKRRRLEGPADESLSESPVEVAEPNADGSGVDPPSQVAESSHLVEDLKSSHLYESGILGAKKALADSDGVEMPRRALLDSNCHKAWNK